MNLETTPPPTLMTVHAHPDDEVLFTGGVLALAHHQGMRTVLVTCTGGELGFGPEGVGYGTARHDPDAVGALRGSNLEESASVLGITELCRLGYRDSGMAGWPENVAPGAFIAAPIDEAVDRLGALMALHRPDVVVTYDADGFYGHPDHIRAHKITLAAARSTGIPKKVYFVTMARSELLSRVALAEEAGFDLPIWLRRATRDDIEIGTDDERITTRVDCSMVIDRKHAALGAHASQSDLAPFLSLDETMFAAMFSEEFFVRDFDLTNSPLPESDLFTGIA